MGAEDSALCTHRARIEGNPKNGAGMMTLSLLLTVPGIDDTTMAPLPTPGRNGDFYDQIPTD